MWTEVRISFSGHHIPGGAQAVLGPANLGPDVATVEDSPVLRSVDVDVTLDQRDPRLPVLRQLLKQYNEEPLEQFQDHYTDDELEQARLIVAVPSGSDYIVSGGPRMGTKYDMSNACPRCGAGARQTSALMINGRDLATMKGLSAASTHYCDFLVDESLAEKLEDAGATGLSFRSVYAVMKDKRQVKQRWRQICAAHTLPRMSPSTIGIDFGEEACTTCDRGGYTQTHSHSFGVVYRAEDLEAAQDVNLTWEWFGRWTYKGDVSTALIPYPWLLVTPKVWRVFRDAGVKSFVWLAVRTEDVSSAEKG